MANIFTLENISDFSEKINIDDLYEKKKQYDLSKLALYNKLLNRIHVKIKTTARQKLDEQFCWYIVPEIMIGVPKYDQGACIAYIMDKLKENGFAVRYIHPNLLFICWKHWVPSYVRMELKKKTGIEIDEHGQKVSEIELIEDEPKTPNDIMFKNLNAGNSSSSSSSKSKSSTQNKKYTPIQSYKPIGNFVYNDDLLSSLEEKFL